jgi:anaerobic sulfite reductase subunit C
MSQFDIIRDEALCIGCGECVKSCPTRAWTRSDQTYFRLLIMGRTGKKNPRLAALFLKWASEEVVVQVIKNTYDYVKRYIDTTLPKEHIGYIVDRTGFDVYKKEVLENVALNPEVKVVNTMSWQGYRYIDDPSVV